MMIHTKVKVITSFFEGTFESEVESLIYEGYRIHTFTTTEGKGNCDDRVIFYTALMIIDE